MQRKVFRIEQMMANARAAAAPSRAALPAEPAGADLRKAEHELAAIYDAIEKSRRELAGLLGSALGGTLGGDSRGRCLARAGGELSAAISGMENATQQILKIAEAIDEGGRALTASLKDDFKRGIAQDIQDQVVKIFEACNYQDLAGQRISKAMATLKFVEESIARVLALWGGVDALRRHAAKSPGGGKLLNGPKLDGDAGHASQREIDRLFA